MGQCHDMPNTLGSFNRGRWQVAGQKERFLPATCYRYAKIPQKLKEPYFVKRQRIPL